VSLPAIRNLKLSHVPIRLHDDVALTSPKPQKQPPRFYPFGASLNRRTRTGIVGGRRQPAIHVLRVSSLLLILAPVV
jgi:hypothetical protein